MSLGAGQPWEEIKNALLEKKKQDFAWKDGVLPSYIYFHSEDLYEKQKEAYTTYMTENALGKGRAFPSLLEMERDVIDMALSFLGAPENGAGIFTSGGTESILLSVRAAKRNAEKSPKFKTPYKIIASETAHPAFNRAADLMGLEVIRLPMLDDFRADVAAMEAAIDDRTIMLVGSAPNYAAGTFDPIAEIGALGLENELWVHVDACVGGFLAPFARLNGEAIPDFDLRLPGVKSLSADIHKYGFAAKGASLLLFADRADRDLATFSFIWARGTYATDGLQGTRPGGAIACAWAMMRHLGVDGYRNLAEITIQTTKRLTDGIDQIAGLKTIRPFHLCIFSYASADPSVDIHAVGDLMEQRGWFIGRSQRPVPSIQMAINPVHANQVETYLADLADCVEQARRSNAKGAFIDGTY